MIIHVELEKYLMSYAFDDNYVTDRQKVRGYKNSYLMQRIFHLEFSTNSFPF